MLAFLLALAAPAHAVPTLAWFEPSANHEFRISGSHRNGVVSSQGWRTTSGAAMDFAGACRTQGILSPHHPARLLQLGLKERTSPIAQEVLFRSVYPGIDLRYHFRDGLLEFDFELQPGASPEQIRLRPTVPVQLTAEGRLKGREFVQHKPVAWTLDAKGRKTLVDVSYKRVNAEWRFALGPYDRAQRLTLDPAITFGTYFSGAGFTQFRSAVTDPTGNLYLLLNLQPDGSNPPLAPLPGVTPDMSAQLVVAKVTPSGSLVYVARLWSYAQTAPLSMVADRRGNLYLAAFDSNPPLRTTSGLFPDGSMVLLKINPQGNAVPVVCRLPGLPKAMAVDAAENIYLVLQGIFDEPAVQKLNPTATSILATAGVENPGDTISHIALNPDGDVVVAGTTTDSATRAEGAYQITNAGVNGFLFDPESQISRAVRMTAQNGEALRDIVGDANSPDRLWAEDNNRLLHRSDDFGQTWVPVGILPRANRPRPVLIRTFPKYPEVVGYLSAPGCHLSRDGGLSWEALPVQTCADFRIDPDSRDRIVAWTAGRMDLSTDGGKTFQPSFAAQEAAAYSTKRLLLRIFNRLYHWGFGDAQPTLFDPLYPLSSITANFPATLFDPADDNAGFALNSGRLVRISQSIEMQAVVPDQTQTLAIHPAQPGVFYAVLTNGVAFTSDGGKSWSRIPAVVPAASYKPIVNARGQLLLYKPAGTDVFFLRLSPDLSQRLGSTTFGANGVELLQGLAITDNGNVVLAGLTSSTDWLTSNQGEVDTFAAIFDPQGKQLRAFRLIGGSGRDFVNGVFTDPSGAVVLAGTTSSGDLELSQDAFAPVSLLAGTAPYGSFLAVLDASLAPVFISSFNGEPSIPGSAGERKIWIVGHSTGGPVPGSTLNAKPSPNGDVYIGQIDLR